MVSVSAGRTSSACRNSASVGESPVPSTRMRVAAACAPCARLRTCGGASAVASCVILRSVRVLQSSCEMVTCPHPLRFGGISNIPSSPPRPEASRSISSMVGAREICSRRRPTSPLFEPTEVSSPCVGGVGEVRAAGAPASPGCAGAPSLPSAVSCAARALPTVFTVGAVLGVPRTIAAYSSWSSASAVRACSSRSFAASSFICAASSASHASTWAVNASSRLRCAPSMASYAVHCSSDSSKFSDVDAISLYFSFAASSW